METTQATGLGRLGLCGAAILVAILVGSLVPTRAPAAPGDLDQTFSGDGKQTTDFRFGLSSAAAVVHQPDGKIIAVGSDDAHFDFALARYNPNGSLDSSFSGDGRQTTEFGDSTSAAAGVALQDDGKIIVVGFADFHQTFALARYNPNGSLDASFSGDGRRTTDFGAFEEGANGVAVQGNGKIVAVGAVGGNFALARYNPNGSLDPSFSGDGKQTTVGLGGATGVALRADGKIVAVGGGGDDFALARYNPSGSLDAGFSGDGKQTTDFGGSDRATGVALQGDGKIVAVGFAGEFGTPDSDFALARYNPNGSLDSSFSGDGRQTIDFGASFGEGANGVAVQGDGKIVVVGDGGGGGIFGKDFALARFNPNGALDPSFSGDGKQTTDFAGSDGASGLALRGGKIVAVGNAGLADFALARYNPNGTLDASFSGNGKQTTDFASEDQAGGVALQADGKIVAVGSAAAIPGATESDFAMARYKPNGSLDASFSGDGRRTTDFGGFLERASGVAVQPNGKIVVVGSTQPDLRTEGDFALARYNPNGTLDASFSGDGKQTTEFGGFDEAADVALQPNGKIVTVGSGGGGESFALARYRPGGALDPSFSGDGKQTTDFGGFDGAAGVARQGDGKIVAVGGVGGENFALARYNPNGSLDASFSGDGKQTTDFGGSPDFASGVALQGDGRIVAAGARAGAAGANFALARYNPGGALDATFSGDGKQTTDFGGFDVAAGVAFQPNGKIVAVGGGANGDFVLARYNLSGLLDPAFSGDGKQTTDFGGDADGARDAALQGDGGVIAVGVGRGTDGSSDFALARYQGGGAGVEAGGD